MEKILLFKDNLFHESVVLLLCCTEHVIYLFQDLVYCRVGNLQSCKISPRGPCYVPVQVVIECLDRLQEATDLSCPFRICHSLDCNSN